MWQSNVSFKRCTLVVSACETSCQGSLSPGNHCLQVPAAPAGSTNRDRLKMCKVPAAKPCASSLSITNTHGCCLLHFQAQLAAPAYITVQRCHHGMPEQCKACMAAGCMTALQGKPFGSKQHSTSAQAYLAASNDARLLDPLRP